MRLRLKKRSREGRANPGLLRKAACVREMPSLNQEYYSSRKFSGNNILNGSRRRRTTNSVSRRLITARSSFLMWMRFTGGVRRLR